MELINKPVAWQFYQDGKWWIGDEKITNHRANAEAAGIMSIDIALGLLNRVQRRHADWDVPQKGEGLLQYLKTGSAQ